MSWTGSRKPVMINSSSWGSTIRQGNDVTGAPVNGAKRDTAMAFGASAKTVGSGTTTTANGTTTSSDDPMKPFEEFCLKIRENPKLDLSEVNRPISRRAGEKPGTAPQGKRTPGSSSGPPGNTSSNSGTATTLANTLAQTSSASAAATAADMRRIERDLSSKRQQKEEAKKESENLRKIKVAEWMQTADKHIKRLRRENNALTRIAQLTQDNALDNDARYEESLASLRAQIEFTTVYRGESTETTRYMRESMNAIQERIREMRTGAERLKETELQNLRSAFDEQVTHWTDRLEKAKSDGEETTQQWVQENADLRKRLEQTLTKADTAYHQYKRLQGAHRRLLIENQAQSDDAALLAKQWNLVSAQHRRLKDRVQDLESEIAYLREGREPLDFGAQDPYGDYADVLANEEHTTPSGMNARAQQLGRPPPTAPGGKRGGTSAQQPLLGGGSAPLSAEEEDLRRQQHELAIRRSTQLLEVEAHNLQVARHAHVQALKQRTELEVYMRQTVVKHQSRLAEEHYARKRGQKADSGGLPNLVSGAGRTSNSAPPTRPTTSSAAKQLQRQSDEADQLSYTNFSTDDRRLVMEVMLSLPRVIELLFGPGGVPSSPATRKERFIGEDNADEVADAQTGVTLRDLHTLGIDAPVGANTSGGGGGSDEDEMVYEADDPSLGGEDKSKAAAAKKAEREMEVMWRKWQRWTRSADRNLEVENAKRKAVEARRANSTQNY